MFYDFKALAEVAIVIPASSVAALKTTSKPRDIWDKRVWNSGQFRLGGSDETAFRPHQENYL